jgi:hypothetical protein
VTATRSKIFGGDKNKLSVKSQGTVSLTRKKPLRSYSSRGPVSVPVARDGFGMRPIKP